MDVEIEEAAPKDEATDFVPTVAKDVAVAVATEDPTVTTTTLHQVEKEDEVEKVDIDEQVAGEET